MSNSNERLVRRVFDEIFSQGKAEAADEVFSADLVVDNGMPGDVIGPENTKQTMRLIRSAFPDFKAEVQDIFSAGDKVVARWIGKGTHKGEFMGIAPTGKKVEMRVIDISQVKNGKITQVWANPDLAGVMQQLGAAGL